jgi:hypothetical protein
MDHPDFFLPPTVGDIYCRDDTHLGHFEVGVTGVNTRQHDWVAHVSTDDGALQLTKSDFQNARSHDQWRPKSWRWDDARFCFAPAHLKWDSEGEAWVKRVADAKEEVKSSLPPKTALPRPEKGEHHATWRSRCRRKFPSLDCPEGQLLLGEYWNEFKTRE